MLRDDLANILASDAYMRQAEAMIRRECPGCTCGVESSLAMKHAASSAFYQISQRKQSCAPVQSAASSRSSAAASVTNASS
jgi:hypothetical protein